MFLAGRAVTKGSPTCCGAELGAMPGSSDTTSQLPSRTPQLWGLTLHPATPPPSWHLLLVVALHKRGFPKAALFILSKYSPNRRKLSQSHAQLWQESGLDGSLISLVLTTTSGNLKGNVLTAISNPPWRAFSDHFFWTPRTLTNGVHCLRVQEGWLEHQKMVVVDPLLFYTPFH